MPPSSSSACSGRLAVGPHALLQRAAQLGVVGLAHEVVALVVERRIQEEPLVLELEMLLLADAALAQGEQLLTLGKGAHGDGPFFERDRHVDGIRPRELLPRRAGIRFERRDGHAIE